METSGETSTLGSLPAAWRLKDHRLISLIGWGVVALAIGLTVTATYIARQDTTAKGAALFELAAKDIERDIQERMAGYGQALIQTRGFLEASGSVSRSEFATYVKSIDLDALYPGIQGIGFVVKIPADELEPHLRGIRTQGFPDYSVRPHTPRDFYYPITLIEPFNWRNQRAFGYDMMTEGVRRRAMELARDTGQLTLSGKVRLVQETDLHPQPGLLLYVPKYARDARIDTPEDRQAALEGFIYSPFRAIDLMQGIFGERYKHDQAVSFEVYDGLNTLEANLLYSRIKDGLHRQFNTNSSQFSKTTTLTIFGNAWTVRTYSLPEFRAQAAPSSPTVTATAGIVFTILIIRLVMTLQKLGQTAERLRSSEDSYRTLTEVAPQIVWAATVSAGNVYINRFWSDYTGMAPAQALGSGWQHALHPADIKIMQDAWQQAIRDSSQSFECEMRIRRHDGQFRWHLSRARLMPRLSGHDSKWLGVATDIHDRKMTEQVLSQREAHLQLIMDSIPALIAYISVDCKYLSVNKTYESWFQINKASMIGQTVEGFHGPEVAKALLPFMKRALSGDTVHFEMPIMQQNGLLRHISGTYVPDILEDGKVIGFFVFVMDVSEAKLAEARLQQSYQRFINVARATNDVVWDWQIESNSRWWSDAVTSVFGYDVQTSIMNQTWWESKIHPDDRDQVVASINHHIASQHQSWSEQYRFQRNDGSYAYVHDRGYTVFGLRNELPLQMVGAIQDISERKITEEALLKAKEDAEAANQTKTNFLANMSHEIRTPLGVVLGFSELLAKGELSSEERDRSVEAINRNGELVSSIINDILDISKIEAGRLEIEIVPTNLVSLIDDLNAGFELQAREKGIDYKCSFVGQIPRTITTDALRLKQIIFNIVGNAVKFTQRGSVSLRIYLTNEKEPRKLILEVTDTGPGIAPENTGKLFEAFSQADASTTRKFGGTGLGLALSRRLAQALGGDVILLRTEVDHGSTFQIRIDTGSIDAAVQIPAPAQYQPQPITLDGMRILVVDDSADNRMLIGRILNRHGASVKLVNSGHAGIAEALTTPFDIVLMDIQMPELDGYEATRTLRKAGYRAPIVALTAHALKADRERCLSQGFDGYLTKPIQRLELVSQIAKLKARQTSAG